MVGVASLISATSPCAVGYRVWALTLHPVHLEASALQHAGAAGLHGRSPLLRLQSDERLVALIRRGNHHAFEALVARYQPRLLAFCRPLLPPRGAAGHG